MARITLIIISVFMLAGHGFAQQLTLKDCINIAVENNPEILGLSKSYESGRAKHMQARGSFYPQISASLSESRRVTPLSSLFGPGITIPGLTDPMDTTSYSMGLSLNQNIWDFGRTSSMVSQAKISEKLAYYALEKKKQEIIFNVRKSYYACLSSRAMKEVSHLSVKDMESIYESVKEREKQGIATGIDVLNAEAEYEKIKASANKTGHQTELAVIALANILGKDFQAPIELSGDKLPAPEENAPAFGSFEEVQQKALAERVEFKEFKLQEELASAGITSAYSEWLPSISASGSYNYEDVVNPPRAQSWSATLSISLPLFNGFSSVGKLKSARRDLDGLKHSIETATRSILLQLKNSYYKTLEEKENLSATKKKTEYLEKNFDATEAKYKEGLSSSTDIIDAQTKKATGELEMQQAAYSYAVALNELEYLTGGIK